MKRAFNESRRCYCQRRPSGFAPRAAVLLALGTLVSISGLAQNAPGRVEIDVDTLRQPGVRYEAPRGDAPHVATGLGHSVAAAGLVNGDDEPDLLVASDGVGAAGQVWLLAGGRTPRSTTQSLFALRPGEGTRFFSGLDAPDRFGAFVAGAGDVDDDGLDDFLIGMPSDQHPLLSHGGVFLVLGQNRLPNAINLLDLRGGGVLIEAPGQPAPLGLAGAGIGDVNGDGIDDFALGIPDALVGAPGAPGTRRGRVVVLFGAPQIRNLARLPRPVFSVDEIEAPVGLEIDGVLPGSKLGRSIAALGDLDDDGFDDFAIGAPRHGTAEERGGAVFIIFGGPHLEDGPPGLSSGNDPNVLRIDTSNHDSLFGAALAGGRDVTGDGIPDLVVGAPNASREDVAGVGLAAILPGGGRLRGVRSVRLERAMTILWGQLGSDTGASVALVPDRNGDGVDEILVGAPAMAARRGRAYLAFGGETLQSGLFLEELLSSNGRIFSHGNNSRPGPVQLGRSVAGLPDRDGDGRGEIVVGAPGFRPGRDGIPPEGAVYEIFEGDLIDVEDGGPRHLTCRQLSGSRVRLSWSLTRRFRSLQVLRSGNEDDYQVIATLPGDRLVFVDPEPGRGENRYIVQANDDEGLRSNTCRLAVSTLPVRDLRCERLAGTSSVRVQWQPGDVAVLTVKVDGNVVEGLESLPPSTRSVVLELEPQANGDLPYFIEVCSRDDNDAACACCEASVPGLALPPLADFRCSPDPDSTRHVKLQWTPRDEYAEYEIFRNSVLILRLPANDASGSHVDTDVPPFGHVVYTLRGLVNGVHPGPFTTCSIDVSPEDSPRISGHVVFDDKGSTAVKRGVVFLRNRQGGGEIVHVGNVNEEGEFTIAVPDPGLAFDLEFRAEYLRSDSINGLEVLPVFRGERAGEDGADNIDAERSLGALVAELLEVRASDDQRHELIVPLPVVAVSPGRSGIYRWRNLHERLLDEDRALLFLSTTTGGIARGTIRIRNDIQTIRRLLVHEFGSAPTELDMIAFGFAGLAARLYTHTAPTCDVRRLVLVGTPHQGTPRALVELRTDAGVRPNPHGFDAPAELTYKAADEQTGHFLELFNERVTRGCGTTIHLLGGLDGKSELDGVLGCTEHDGRVCLDSALALDLDGSFFDNAHRHEVLEDHSTLAQGDESLDVVLDNIGIGLVRALAADEGPPPAARAAGGGDGGGAGNPPADNLSLGKVSHGEIVPGGDGRYFFTSDTSGSIIIILNSDDEGALDFFVRTPSDELVDSANAGKHNAIYLSYNDGEGNLVQTYKFLSGEVGSYEVTISSDPSNPVVQYSLEFHLDSPIKLNGELDESDVELGDTPKLTAVLENVEQLPAGISLVTTASLVLPDGSLEVIALHDDGLEGDAVADDGVFTSILPPSDQPGYHVVEIQINDGPEPTFERAATLQLLVRSDLATLDGEFDSGADPIEDGEGDGGGAGEQEDLNQNLWVRGSVESTRGGSLIVLGTLTDLQGNTVAQAGTIFSLFEAQPAEFRVDFDGYEIYGSERDGPYRLVDLEILDAGVGFVRADLVEDAHETAPYSWRDFGVIGGLPFVRGDANVDQNIDLSDAIVVLSSLFTGGDPLLCQDSADANADGTIDLSDGLTVVNYLFLGITPTLEPPFPECGQAADLGCEYYPYCY